MPGPVLCLTLPAAVGDGVTSGAPGELVLLPLASLVTLVTPVPVCQVLGHVETNLIVHYLKSEEGKKKKRFKPV